MARLLTSGAYRAPAELESGWTRRIWRNLDVGPL